MKVFSHHLYEYCKGLRNLVLHTLERSDLENATARLEYAGIDYKVYPLGKKRANIFFGADECVNVIRKIGKSSVKQYSPEEDFILGVMLGYERRKQCERYLKNKENEVPVRLCRCAVPGACAEVSG